MLNRTTAAIRATALPVRVALVAALLSPFNAWVGLLLALTGAWLHLKAAQNFDFHARLKSWFALPFGLSIATALLSQNTPADDLLRHLMAWRTELDYRAQYPWSDLPEANLWLGFDWLVGKLQTVVGIPASLLLAGIPAVAVVLAGLVSYGSIKRAAPRLSPEAMLLFGALALAACAPRMLLGRPEAFVSLMGAAAWLCTSRKHVIAWVVGFLALIPFYWIGWAYAPMALVLPLALRSRVLLAATLGGAHLLFWQTYTGDYLGLMQWLRGTLDVLAIENYDMSHLLLNLPDLCFALLLSWLLSLDAKRPRLLALLPIAALIAWFALPNQIRYGASMVMMALPWMAARFQLVERARRLQGKPLQFSPLLVVAVLAFAGVKAVPAWPAGPTFSLPATARVLSEQPYTNAFYGEKGIALDPSFAIGATRPQWKNILDTKTRSLDCARFRAAGFTHLVEHSLNTIPACVELTAVQGEWRLWRLKNE